MKKVTIILLSMLLVLSIGQAAFANYELGLIIGYGNKSKSFSNSYYGYEVTENLDMPLIGIYGEHEFTEGFFVSFKEKISLGKLATITPQYFMDRVASASYAANSFKTEVNAMEIYFDLFLKMNIFSAGSSRVGLQIGVMNDYLRLRSDNPPIPNYSIATANMAPSGDINKFNAFFWAVGAYADVKVGPKTSVYGDIKVPIFVGANDTLKYHSSDYYYYSAEDYFGFFKSFLYDLTFGLKYDIDSNVYLGFEGTLTNSTVYDLRHAANEGWGSVYEKTPPSFNIGATLGYRF